VSTATPARPKRLRVKHDRQNLWAFTCPLCGKGFANNLLFSHVDDHRDGRFGYERVDVLLEVTMVVPSSHVEAPSGRADAAGVARQAPDPQECP
jgi:hypothetical protein